MERLTDEQSQWVAKWSHLVGQIRRHRHIRRLWKQVGHNESVGEFHLALMRLSQKYDGRAAVPTILSLYVRRRLSGVLRRRKKHQTLSGEVLVTPVHLEIPPILRRRYIDGVSVVQLAAEAGVTRDTMVSRIQREKYKLELECNT